MFSGADNEQGEYLQLLQFYIISEKKSFTNHPFTNKTLRYVKSYNFHFTKEIIVTGYTT